MDEVRNLGSKEIKMAARAWRNLREYTEIMRGYSIPVEEAVNTAEEVIRELYSEDFPEED